VGWLVSWLIGLLAVVSVVSAQTPVPEGNPPTADDVNRVAANLYCPVCENEPLDVCQTSACVQWKAQIAQYLAEGRSDREIIRIFVERYGLRVLGEPPAEGVTLLLWLAPLVVAAFGAFLALRLIRRLSQRPSATPAQPAPSTGDPYVEQVERELKQRL
jgi:cytochrome c-type biogenesis protein CcmH